MQKNPLKSLDPNTALSDAIVTAFSIREYVEIINAVKNDDFNADPEFRKRFNGYYRVRQRKPVWYDRYYTLMVEQKECHRSFGEVLTELSAFGSVEVSFASKMIAAVEPDKPIWDQYVIRNLGFEHEWRSFSGKAIGERIEKAELIYSEMEQWYQVFLESSKGKRCIKKFDAVLPEYKDILSNTKKVDFLLVFKR